MLDKAYYTYIVASRSRVIYVGVTSKIRKRVWQHKIHHFQGFSARYCCEHLVWIELHHDPWEAIAREKELKGWTRKKKIALIEAENPFWSDLAGDWWPEEFIREHRRSAEPAESDASGAG